MAEGLAYSMSSESQPSTDAEILAHLRRGLQIIADTSEAPSNPMWGGVLLYGNWWRGIARKFLLEAEEMERR